jgi:hypothetical protein
MGGRAPEAIDSGIGFFRNRSTRYNGQSGVMFEASARPKRLGSASRQGDNKMPPRDGDLGKGSQNVARQYPQKDQICARQEREKSCEAFEHSLGFDPQRDQAGDQSSPCSDSPRGQAGRTRSSGRRRNPPGNLEGLMINRLRTFLADPERSSMPSIMIRTVVQGGANC